MRGRPEILFPLFAALEGLKGIGPRGAAALAGLGVEVPRDLLFILPEQGIDRRQRPDLTGINPPEVVTVLAEVIAHHAPRSRGRPHRVAMQAGMHEFHLIFFHAKGDYLQKLLPIGEERLVSGRMESFDGSLQMPHPDHVLALEAASSLPEFEPVYPLTAGITRKSMQKSVQAALERAPRLEEWIDPGLKAQESWPGWREALIAAHAPASAADLAASSPARARLAYDEVFAHQLTLALVRQQRRAVRGRESRGEGRLLARLLAALPYAPTGAQNRAIAEITADLAAPERMHRLLQGDVGAGKTLVAMAALLAVVEAGGQGALMAPTEILARQHYQGLAPLAAASQVRLEILTGRDKGRERLRKLEDLAGGKIDILVGTHAVFQPDVHFADLRLAVIDEQHRFGVAQRMALGEKGEAVDTLVMTATPIPRSLALAQYGDLDLTILDEKPPGRVPITTTLAPTARIDEVVAHLRRAIAEGRQAYWVCPLVEESELSDLTAATTRFDHLRAQLGERVVGMVHGQMPVEEKDAAMAAFVAGATRVLVATTVIEVGVDVPGATIMVIERAESFGLAQLHQLRGRVGRGGGSSSCLLLYDSPLSETATRRLKLLRETEDGFRLSEEDLAMRGAGDVIGTAQSGLPRFRIADLERQAGLMQLAQSDARKLLNDDPALETDRGRAARLLLWLLGHDRAVRLIRTG